MLISYSPCLLRIFVHILFVYWEYLYKFIADFLQMKGSSSLVLSRCALIIVWDTMEVHKTESYRIWAFLGGIFLWLTKKSVMHISCLFLWSLYDVKFHYVIFSYFCMLPSEIPTNIPVGESDFTVFVSR
jgi:hypothetical protein